MHQIELVEFCSHVSYDPSTDIHSPPALSADAEPVKLSSYVTTLPPTHSVAIFIGAMARGEDSFADGIVDQKISISKYSLSASVSVADLCATCQ